MDNNNQNNYNQQPVEPQYQQQPQYQQPYQAPYQQPYQPQPELKSKMAAGLLGIFLGAWGIHNFYLGFTTRGIIQIVLTMVSCGIGGLWGFIEGILYLTGSMNVDAQGNPLRD